MAAAISPPDAARWTRGVLIIFTMFGFAFGNWLARLPAVRDHLGASTMQMSFIGLTIAAGAVAGLLFAGRTVTWLGPRRALFYSAIGQAIALPLGSLMLWTGFVIPGLVVLANLPVALGKHRRRRQARGRQIVQQHL